MEVTRTFAETRSCYRGRVGLLPTLGYLHEGHLRLVELLRDLCDTLVMSLFVNPTQFNDADDYQAYPRDEERDADKSARPEKQVEIQERSEQIRAALLSLPPNYRVVIELRHYQDLSYDEISQELSIPLSDVKSHLFRARKLLAEKLHAPD